MKYFIYLFVITSILLSNNLEEGLLSCLAKEDTKSKLICYDDIASKINSNKKNVTITGTAFVKDNYSGQILAVCKGDTIFLVPTEKDADFLSLDLLISGANLSYAQAESKRLHGNLVEEKKLLNYFYTTTIAIEEKLNFLKKNTDAYQTKCNLNGNFSISNIPKGEYNFRVYIKNLDTGSYFLFSETKSVTQNEEITLIGE